MLSVPTRMDVYVECAHKIECLHQCCVTVQFHIPLKMFVRIQSEDCALQNLFFGVHTKAEVGSV